MDYSYGLRLKMINLEQAVHKAIENLQVLSELANSHDNYYLEAKLLFYKGILRNHLEYADNLGEMEPNDEDSVHPGINVND